MDLLSLKTKVELTVAGTSDNRLRGRIVGFGNIIRGDVDISPMYIIELDKGIELGDNCSQGYISCIVVHPDNVVSLECDRVVS